MRSFAVTETESEPLFNSDHAIDIELWSVTCIDENDLQFDCKIDITNNITALVPGPQYDMGGKGSPRCQHVVTDVSCASSFTCSREGGFMCSQGPEDL